MENVIKVLTRSISGTKTNIRLNSFYRIFMKEYIVLLYVLFICEKMI